MGLDMYLHKSTYVQNWGHTPEVEKHNITITKGGINRKDIELERIKYIVEEIGYWRKANQIHNWFVTNVQKGEDDCKKYRVSVEQLKILLAEVIQVLDNPNKAKEILPTSKGFFFGDDEYNESYIEDLKDTKVILEDIFKKHNDDSDYTYQSSW